MEVLSFDSFSLKDAITDGKVISQNGTFGAVFLHGSSLLKLDKRLFSLIDINCRELANHVFKDVYRYNDEPFVNKEQIEYFLSLQSQIALTDFDKGIVLVNDRVCGTILTPHLDYKDLTDYKPTSLSELLKILENLLMTLRELEEHGISHEDLAMGENYRSPTFNVLYKDTDVKLCDLSGRFVNYGDKFNPNMMYYQYLTLMGILIRRIKKQYPEFCNEFQRLTYNPNTSYEAASEMLEKVLKIAK